ncbi:hypothetical protein V1525DRAFT_459516 [Lipomyces kononenkoae]|uniref:Uncharacterized protein n=1 Tax=Lipomyces kononenkoae TaxID=34357 RepID=A0ACC3SSH4_LIPKO
MPQMALNTYSQPTLKSPSDWAAWYDNIKTSAQLTLVWDYCNPDVDEGTIRKLVFPAEPENETGYAKYKIQIDIWNNRSQSLARIMNLIRSTVGKDYQLYLLGARSVQGVFVRMRIYSQFVSSPRSIRIRLVNIRTNIRKAVIRVQHANNCNRNIRTYIN